MRKKKLMSAAALMMAGTLTLQCVEWPTLKAFADDAGFEDSKVLQMSFEDDVKDSTGKHIVSVNGTAGYTEGVKDGKAFDFDGSTYLTLGTDSDLQPENLTVSFWVKRNGNMGGEEMLMWCKGEYNNNGWYIGSPWNIDTAIVFSIGMGVNGVAEQSQPTEYYVQMNRDSFFGTDEWVHVTATYDSEAKEAHIYRNGKEVAVNVINAEAPAKIVSDNCVKSIGSNGGVYNHGANTTLAVDELEVYSSVASSEDVKKLYTKNGGVLETIPDAGDNTEYIGGISAYDLQNVSVTDSYLTNAEAKDIDYLLKLDSDRLLAGFRETAGLDMLGKTRYGGGWEDALIGGHTMGHYLTAMAQAVAELPDTDARKAQVENKLNYIIAELEKCQNAIGTGFIFGARILDKNNIELQFDNVEKSLTDIGNQAWVPWYTMHKIVAGLIDTYKYTGNNTALSVAKKLGDWVYNRVSKWDIPTQNNVLAIEYGGMNDCLYELYAVTGEDKYAEAAHKFDEENLFKLVAADSPNALNNKHANTTIPKFLGAMNRYVTTNGKIINGETVNAEEYLVYAEKFFDMVVDKHSYIIGDNSEWEHFGADYVLDAERTNCNCETCNAYNMMKLAKGLYMITGNSKYSDFYEQAFYNTILSSQNPETGMTTYFQPMATGYFKVYGTPEGNFWCCTGSGMENFTKLGNAIYYHTNDMVIVNQYLSSVLTDTEKNIKLTQTADIPASDIAQFTVNSIDGTDISAKLALRLPEWLAGDATVTVNGAAANPAIESGYAVLEGLKNDDKVVITLPMELRAYNLPDNEAEYAFKYGPIVLSAKLGTSNMTTSTTGVNVTIPSAKLIEDKYITDKSETVSVINGTVADFMANINDNLVKTEGKLEWTLENTDANLTFVPHYSQHTERYGIYFNYISNTGAFNATKYIATKAQDRFINALLDTVQPGYGQYENDELHDMKNDNSIGVTDDGTYRYAQAGGSFTYTMKVAKGEDNYIQVSFRKADNGKSIKFSVGGTEVYNTVLDYSGEEDEYTVRIKVPSDVVEAAVHSKTVTDGTYDVVDVKIESADDKDSARVCSYLYTTKAYSNDAGLSLEASKGVVTKDAGIFTVNVGNDVTALDLTAKLASEYGYIRMNGTVARETVPYTVDLSRNNFVTLNITVFAEDHETSADYTVNIIKEADLANRADVDKNLAYFVNCGDYDVTTLSEGDLFGLYNGVTDQAYGVDPVTGYTWGIKDTVSNPLTNGIVENNAAMTNAAFTDWTWPFETDAFVTDASAKTATNRYTKNQFESNVARNLNYSFGLPNGEYTVELYFTDPWNCSKNPIISAEGQKLMENTPINEAVTAKVSVTDNILDLNITAPEATLCINLAYIKIYMPEVKVPEELTTEEPTTEEPTTEGLTTGQQKQEESTTGENKKADSPTNTGDNSNTGAYTALLCLSFAVIAAAVFGKKRRETE